MFKIVIQSRFWMTTVDLAVYTIPHFHHQQLGPTERAELE